MLVHPDVDGVALFEQAEARFGDDLEILKLVAASPVRALFVAKDRVLKRQVGLRVHLQPDSALRNWFERETELMAALEHPVLRPVHAAGRRSDWAYRIVKWVDGESLADAVTRGPRPIPAVLQLARQLTSVLEYVHSRQIVIRHLIPATVMIDHTERTFVTDLRYANVLIALGHDDSDQYVVPFRAPEIRGGESGEPTADIYSAGAVLYFAVTGRPPDADPEAIVPPRSQREACPRALERIIERALDPKPSKRFLTAAEMISDLLSDLGDFHVPAPLYPESPGQLLDSAQWEKQLRRALGDDYELLDELGSGGFGRVYRVRDLALEREVALKVLHPYLTADSSVVERFRREARLAAQVVHPYIANTYEFGGRAGLLWYTMEYVRGLNVARLVRQEGPQPVERVLRMMTEALTALQYAHSRGLMHRDLKPENLLIEDGTGNVHILDFGLAVPLRRVEGFGATSGHSGTPEYAAPEQLLGESVDHRADLYSLSLVAYYMLTGETPFGASTIEAVVARQTAGILPDLAVYRKDLPEALRRVLIRGAAREPVGRFATAEEYRRAIEDLPQARGGLMGRFVRGLFGTR
jgi:serine/threonine-protein kinase